jgi:hypothetical protein
MRRLPARHVESGEKQEAASLALCVWGHVGQIIGEASCVVSEVLLDAMGGVAYRGVRKAGVDQHW